MNIRNFRFIVTIFYNYRCLAFGLAPSPTNMMMSMDGGDAFDGHKESNASTINQHPAHNTTQSTIASAQSLSSVHRYVPDYVAISNRKTAV